MTKGNASSTVLLPIPIFGDTQTQAGVSGDSNSISIDSAVFTVADNVVILNQGETGSGVTKPDKLGGYEIDRGKLPDYQAVFNEATQTFQVGFINHLQTVPVLDNSITSSTYNYPFMNGNNLIVAPNADNLGSVTQNLSSNDSPTFQNLTLQSGTITFGGTAFQFPLMDGPSGALLSTDGNGNLSWLSESSLVVPPATPGTVSDQLLGVTPDGMLKRLSIPENLPSTSTPNSVLVTDSNGTVIWELISSLGTQVGGSGGGTYTTDKIYNSANGSMVETNNSQYTNAVVITSGSSTTPTVAAVLNTQATWQIPTVYSSGVAYPVKSVPDATYTLTTSDLLINWTCPTNGIINLPPVTSCPGQIYIIQHKSISGVTLTIVPNASDAVRSMPYQTLTDPDDNIRLISDAIDNWIIV